MKMTKKTRFLVTCGGTAADIKGALGPRAKMRKIMPGEPVGNYGDFIFEAQERDAVLMKLRYSNVTLIP